MTSKKKQKKKTNKKTKKTTTFCGFSMGRNQYWAGMVYDLCVYYMTGTPEGSTESSFMEKPGIEPATPDLQGIALIHYTTGASRWRASVFLTLRTYCMLGLAYITVSIKISIWLKYIHIIKSK